MQDLWISQEPKLQFSGISGLRQDLEGNVKEVKVEFLIRCKLKCAGVICRKAGNIQEQSGIGKDSLAG